MLIDDQPVVTVYIPTFNRLELLQRAVESVRNQTYQNLEIIIVDDHSTDGTQDYLVQLSKEDSRIRYFFKEKNTGACASRNIAINDAKGEFITGLDDDDYFKENRIEIFLKSWEKKNKSTKILYSLYLRKTKNGVSRPLKKIRKFFLKKHINAKDLLYYFYIGNQIFTQTNLLKEIFFDVNFPAWQDFECYYRFLKELNCNAELVPEESYVVDISHPHERISTKKINNILDAYNNFQKKHNISNFYLVLLRCHLYNYPGVDIRIRDVFLRFIYKPSFLDFKRIVNRNIS